MTTILLDSLFCADHLMPLLVGLLGAGLLGWLLKGFMGGSSSSSTNEWQTKYEKANADLQAEKARSAKLQNKEQKKKSNTTNADATAMGVSAAAASASNAEVETLKNKLNNLRGELKASQEATSVLEGQITAAKARAAEATTLNSEVETLKARIEGLNRALETNKSDAEKYKGEFESANSERARLSAQIQSSDLGALNKQIEKLQTDLQAARMTNGQLQSENDRLANGPKTIVAGMAPSGPTAADIARLNEQIAELKKETADAKADADRFKRDSDTAKLAINAAVNAANEKSNLELGDMRRQLKYVEADLVRARDENTKMAQQSTVKAVEIKQAEAPSAPTPKAEPVAAPKVEVEATPMAASAPVVEEVASVAAPIIEAEPVAEAPKDDLTIIEGVGPAIGKLLNDAGVNNFAQLAAMSASDVKEILEDAGNKLANPSTWPEQAALLRDGKMDEFRALEKELVGGLRVEKTAEEAPANPDDLKVLEGVGPVLERILNEGGIYTYAKLASSSADNLRKILEDAGDKMHDPATWPEQAALLRDGKMEEFKQLTDMLMGGRKGE
jgi:predicted flap endonuclease-1-like 5' DNA nuclease